MKRLLDSVAVAVASLLLSGPVPVVGSSVEPAFGQVYGPDYSSAIPIEEVIRIARANYPNVGIKEVELDFEKKVGILVWEVKFFNGAKLYVDPRSGSVIGRYW
ncbi:MAG: PepSY domain-containing protein [Thermostichus sp. DG02_5_bins_236]